MKLNEHFIYHPVDGEPVVVPTAGAAFHGLIEGNRTTGLILESLARGTSEEEIVAALCGAFRGDEATVRSDVSRVLGELRAIGAIDE